MRLILQTISSRFPVSIPTPENQTWVSDVKEFLEEMKQIWDKIVGEGE